ncbi:hypothetical protein HDU96_005684 [Phlyctochytrium bullatum]|nr:hypothetical protein HDU96_005684 [Phlyctochytrium bullatum]
MVEVPVSAVLALLDGMPGANKNVLAELEVLAGGAVAPPATGMEGWEWLGEGGWMGQSPREATATGSLEAWLAGV